MQDGCEYTEHGRIVYASPRAAFLQPPERARYALDVPQGILRLRGIRYNAPEV